MPLSPRVAALAVATLAPLPALAEDGVLNVYCWEDYVAPDQREAFSAETGLEVRWDVFDSNDMLETRLLAGGASYDVVCPNAVPHLANGIGSGLYQPLDRARLTSLGNLDPSIMAQVAQAADPGNEHAVAWMWGTYGIGYNAERVAETAPDVDLTSWRAVLDPEHLEKLSGCGVDFVDSYRDVIALVLLYLGRDPQSTDPADIDAAVEHLTELRPFIRRVHGSEYLQAMADGDICVAVSYSGDMSLAQARATEAGRDFTIAYNLPVEGSVTFIDTWAIPTGAENLDAAYAWLNFVTQPEVAAASTNYLAYINANAAATDLVNPAIRDDPGYYPTEEVKSRLFIAAEPPQDVRRTMQRAWQRFLRSQ